MFLSLFSQGDLADVSLSVLENRPNLGRTYRPVRAIQSPDRSVLPVDRLLADVLLPMETQTRFSDPIQRIPRVQTSEPTKDTIEIELTEAGEQARGFRKQPNSLPCSEVRFAVHGLPVA